MKHLVRIVVSTSSLLVLFALVAAARPAWAEPSRFAVVVGTNQGDPGEKSLRYAEEDARRIAETLRTVGQFAPDQIALLLAPTADDVRSVLLRVNARLRAIEGDSLLFVFFSGHGDADNLHLGGTRLPNADLSALLAGSPAASRVLVVDACRSGAITRVKGGRPGVPFAVAPELPPPPKGLAILTSSGSTEDAQESDSLRSSFFTHFLNSGLMGAADHNQDGWVTLGEAFAFASGETLLATARTAAGPQHPTYHFELGGRQDLVLSRSQALSSSVGGMRLGHAGRYLIQRIAATGERRTAAEVSAGTRGARIALPPGRYEIMLRSQHDVYQGEAEVKAAEVTEIQLASLERMDYPRMIRKGTRDSAWNAGATFGVRRGYLDLGDGPAVMLSLRRHGRFFSIEGRLGYDRSNNHRDYTSQLQITTQTLSASVLLHKAIHVDPFVFAPGVEIGAVGIRQTFAPGTSPPVVEPFQLPAGSSKGALIAPVLLVELPFWTRAFARFEVARPTLLLKVANSRTTEWLFRDHTRLMLGGGMYF